MGSVLWFEHVKSEESSDTGQQLDISEIFEARVSDPETALIDLKRHRPDLLRYNPHPQNGQLRTNVWVTRWEAMPREDDHYLFDIRVDYSNVDDEGQQNQQASANFEVRTPTVKTSYKEVLLSRSPNSGKAFVNTAGDLIASVREEVAFWTFDYQFNAPFRPKWTKAYAGAINSDDIKLDGETFTKFQVAMGEIEIVPQMDGNGNVYRSIRAQLITHPEPEGWIREFPNVGFYEIYSKRVGVNGQPVSGSVFETVKARRRINDEEGNPVEKPWWLNSEGGAVRREGDPAKPNAVPPLKVPMEESDFIWLRLDTRKQLPFRALKLR